MADPKFRIHQIWSIDKNEISFNMHLRVAYEVEPPTMSQFVADWHDLYVLLRDLILHAGYNARGANVLVTREGHIPGRLVMSTRMFKYGMYDLDPSKLLDIRIDAKPEGLTEDDIRRFYRRMYNEEMARRMNNH